MPYSEDDLLPISALQHLLYCERQCVLIHVERIWKENRFTAEGAILHKRAHSGRDDTRPKARTTRGLPVRSLALGLFGVTDVVRWEPADGSAVPVEYKRGRSKVNDCDRVQLCAQAICLEEMRGITIPHGELFYGQPRRKELVELGTDLRATTIRAAARLHELLQSGESPRAVPGKKCDRCSLRDPCLPRLGRTVSASLRFESSLAAMLRDEENPSSSEINYK